MYLAVVQEEVNQLRLFQEVSEDVRDVLTGIRINSVEVEKRGDGEGRRIRKRFEAGDCKKGEESRIEGSGGCDVRRSQW